MYIYLLILRILHIACGIFWTGTALMMVFYIFPAVARSGPDGGKIMQAITNTNKFPNVISLVATVTVLTGYLLMWQLSAGFTPAWFSSRYGIALSIGGFTASIAFVQVILINRPGIIRMQAIGKAVAAKGGVPSDAETNEVGKIRQRIIQSTRLIAFWLIITVVTMAGARYF
jgi:putative copper export protein